MALPIHSFQKLIAWRLSEADMSSLKSPQFGTQWMKIYLLCIKFSFSLFQNICSGIKTVTSQTPIPIITVHIFLFYRLKTVSLFRYPLHRSGCSLCSWNIFWVGWVFFYFLRTGSKRKAQYLRCGQTMDLFSKTVHILSLFCTPLLMSPTI